VQQRPGLLVHTLHTKLKHHSAADCVPRLQSPSHAFISTQQVTPYHIGSQRFTPVDKAGTAWRRCFVMLGTCMSAAAADAVEWSRRSCWSCCCRRGLDYCYWGPQLTLDTCIAVGCPECCLLALLLPTLAAPAAHSTRAAAGHTTVAAADPAAATQ
jgi:hypothetical protein